MIIRNIPTGPLEANCYIVVDEDSNTAMIVDPGDEPDTIIELLEDVNVEFIVLTHGHFDHVGAVAELKASTGAQVAMHRDEVPTYKAALDQAAFWGYSLPPLPEPDILFEEGDEIELGETVFTVIHTPGHSPGSICLYCDKVILTGDTLFAGSVGRTDFPGGSMTKMKASFKRLMGLPDDTAVLSGHGPVTTIGREKSDNFFSYEIGLA